MVENDIFKANFANTLMYCHPVNHNNHALSTSQDLSIVGHVNNTSGLATLATAGIIHRVHGRICHRAVQQFVSQSDRYQGHKRNVYAMAQM